ncbi:MAG: transcription repressor NadR [Clostridiales Family XIII bacterium]|jgi:transcriptional regulator of NAD metabolism|nr:transcription repressor NadR [Clostridiales Family XIII bacterium]
MDAELRRSEILRLIQEEERPVSATSLAARVGVSRQAVVGDVALLRARGNEIIATARGYMMSRPYAGKFIGKIACRHGLADTERELLSIVALGGEVLDVIVAHPYYGDLTGRLGIAAVEDVKNFMESLNAEGRGLLSELTDGVHLHTVACGDRQTFDAIVDKLEQLGIGLAPVGEIVNAAL